MEKTLQQAFDEYVGLVYEMLLNNCPVDTGNMKNHITIETDGKTATIIISTTPFIQKTGKSREYAYYTEFVNRTKEWIRKNSLLEAAFCVGDEVYYGL